MSKQNRKHCLEALLRSRTVSMDMSSGHKHVHVRTDARTYVDGPTLSCYLPLSNARRGAAGFIAFGAENRTIKPRPMRNPIANTKPNGD